MAEDWVPRRSERGIAAFVRAFPSVHNGIGVLGNALFVVGSVLFIREHQDVGVWFFLTGSVGMFIGSLGHLIRVQGRRTLWRRDIDPEHPWRRWTENL